MSLPTIYLLISVAVAGGTGDLLESPINDHPVPRLAPDQPHSFWVAGHLYGSHGNRTSVFPASSFLANVDRLRDSDASLMLLVGDNVRRPEPMQLERFQQVMRRFPFPVFNAPGNHDHPESDAYRRRFGPRTFGKFRVGSSLFVVLDTELDDRTLSGRQLECLREWLELGREDPTIHNVFVFCHRLVWCLDHPELARIRPFINSAKHLRPGWFGREIRPALDRLAERKGVYWFSGDVGATWSYSTFYWKDPRGDLHFVATGLGDTERDAILKVNVDGRGRVVVLPVSLTGQELGSIDRYGPSYWTAYFAARKAAEESKGAGSKPVGARTDERRHSVVRLSVTTVILLVVLGILICWAVTRLILSGWSRFRGLRTKYY